MRHRLSAQSQAGKYSTAPPAGWKVPRLADGKPDLQGVWGNNSVTPMTRPTQWKDKSELTDAEVDELQGLPGEVRRSGRRCDLRQPDSTRAEREGQGRVQADAGRSDDRQLQPVLDGRSRVGQPHVAHHRSARWTVPAADARRAGPPRRGGRAPAHARSRGWPGRSPAVRALHFLRRAAHPAELQQLHADHPVARHGGAAAGNDPRRARRADDHQAASAEEDPPAARRSARPLGRRHAGRRDHELHQRLPGLDAGCEDHRALHARQSRTSSTGR